MCAFFGACSKPETRRASSIVMVTGCALSNVVIRRSTAGYRTALSGVVYIGDNSKLFLESAEPRRSLRLAVGLACTPASLNAPKGLIAASSLRSLLKPKRCMMNITLISEVTAEEPRETYQKTDGQLRPLPWTASFKKPHGSLRRRRWLRRAKPMSVLRMLSKRHWRLLRDLTTRWARAPRH